MTGADRLLIRSWLHACPTCHVHRRVRLVTSYMQSMAEKCDTIVRRGARPRHLCRHAAMRPPRPNRGTYPSINPPFCSTLTRLPPLSTWLFQVGLPTLLSRPRCGEGRAEGGRKVRCQSDDEGAADDATARCGDTVRGERGACCLAPGAWWSVVLLTVPNE